jgi:pentatricopeptide repeat protein
VPLAIKTSAVFVYFIIDDRVPITNQSVMFRSFSRSLRTFYASNKSSITNEVQDINSTLLKLRKERSIPDEDKKFFLTQCVDNVKKITQMETFIEPLDEALRPPVHELCNALHQLHDLPETNDLTINLYYALRELTRFSIFTLDTEICNQFLNIFALIGDNARFNYLMAEMKEENIPADQETFQAMIRIAVNTRDYNKAMKIVSVMRKMGFKIDPKSEEILLKDNPLQRFTF